MTRINLETGKKKSKEEVKDEFLTVLPRKRVYREWPNKAVALVLCMAQVGVVRRSLEFTEVPSYRLIQWKKSLKGFRKAWARAKSYAADGLEEALYERAVKGHRTEVWFRGEMMGFRQAPPSDILLIFALKGLRPNKYKDRVGKDDRDTEGLTAKDLAGLLDRMHNGSDSIVKQLPAPAEPVMEGEFREIADENKESVVSSKGRTRRRKK